MQMDPVDRHHFVEFYIKKCVSRDGVIPILLVFADKGMLLLIGSFLSYEITQVENLFVPNTFSLVVNVFIYSYKILFVVFKGPEFG